MPAQGNLAPEAMASGFVMAAGDPLLGWRPDEQSAICLVALAGLLVIGYLLPHGEQDKLLLYGVALGLHFVVNVMKEELPQRRESRFWAFFAGAALYGAILLAV